MSDPNPILKRVRKLSAQWGELRAEPAARVLVWQVRADETRMIEGFLALESEQGAGDYRDLFHPFESAFDSPMAHGLRLVSDFAALYRDGKDVLAEQGARTDWQPPALLQDEGDIAFLIRTCLSFQTHYGLPAAFVLVLRPSAISDSTAYQAWLQQLTLALPVELLLLLLDAVESPSYAALISAEPERVLVRRADLDMPGALEEISNQAGNLESPGGQYRDLFVKLVNALGAQDIALAEQLAQPALAITLAQGWFHLAVPVQAALGAALAGLERFDDAIAQYLAAEQSALAGQLSGAEDMRPTCQKLVVQMRMCRGAALLTAQAWGAAATLFLESAPLAEALGDARASLDCYRLASFGFEKDGQANPAWEAAQAGLNVARAMDEETRKSSTFAFLGEGLLRLCESAARRSGKQQTEREIEQIAGTRAWRPAAQAGDDSGAAA